MISRIVSLQVGLPRVMDPHGEPWVTATFKDPVAGNIALSHLGLAGDGQADLENHGGPDKAVLVYSQDHAERWRREAFPDGLPPGAFGENFTVQDLTEADVCVGDVVQVGTARVEVSQPRQPCWKQGRRYGMNDLVAKIVRTSRTGWYLRVRQEGVVEAGDVWTLLERPYPQWTVEEANRIMYVVKTDRAANLALAACPALSESWSTYLRYRAS